MNTDWETEKNRGDKFLSFLEGLLDLLVDHLPQLGAKFGKLAVATFDIVAGGLFLSYVFNQLTPADFLGVAKVFAWLISAAAYFFVNDLFQKGQSDPDKKMFAWGLNILDAFFIDAAGVFILFGQTGIIEGGFSSFVLAIKSMPIIGWIVYLIAAALSLFAEWYRVGTTGPSHNATPQPVRSASQARPGSNFHPMGEN